MQVKASTLVGHGEPLAGLLVIDPGGTTGWCTWQDGEWAAGKLPLAELPAFLYERIMSRVGCPMVACESYHLLRSHAQQQAGSDMPSAQGIGQCEMALYADGGRDLVMIPPNTKRAGKMALDPAGLECRRACRSEHERDAVDLTGYLLRELRRTAPSKRGRR